MELMVVNRSLVLLLCLVSGHFVSVSCMTSALFLFGDAHVDNGNNNLLPTQVRSNYAPYGISFNNTPSGRFCDGQLIPDILASYMGIPSPPPFLGTGDFAYGTNFGSGASGIFRWPGIGAVLSFSDQVDNFQQARNSLINSVGFNDALSIIGNAIFYIGTGNTDVNNYLHIWGTPLPARIRNALLHEFGQQIERLYSLGARKFVVTGLSEVGCAPIHQRLGRCLRAGIISCASYNAGLSMLLANLRHTYSDAVMVLADSSTLMLQVKAMPRAFGFFNTISSCCPANETSKPCYPGAPVCFDPSKYMFWDVNYPSEAFNKIVAQEWWDGNSPTISPMNISRLASL